MNAIRYEDLPDTGEDAISCELNGIVDGMPSHVYHAREEISKHGLDKIEEAPAKFIHRLTQPFTPTADMRLGTLLHLAALETHRFSSEVAFVPEDAPDRPQARSVNAKRPRHEVLEAAAWWAKFDADNLGREMVTIAELAQINAMRDALMTHPSTGKLLAAGGLTEASMFWRDPKTGVRCRARADRIHASGQFILDVKKTRDASPEGFAKDALNFRYHAQAAMYLDGYRAITGTDARFIFLCQEDEPPFLTACYVATPEFVEAGRNGGADKFGRLLFTGYRQPLETYAACVESGKWPGYGEAVMPLDLPAWTSRSMNPNT